MYRFANYGSRVETFDFSNLPEGQLVSAHAAASTRTRPLGLSDAVQVGVVFALIMVAVWTPPGRGSTIVSLVATLCILWFAVRSRYSVREMGLSRPGSGATVILVSGILLIVAIVFAGWLLHDLGPAQPVPWRRAWKYAIWALEQEFILQSFFFVRLESLLGSRRAVMAAALLFAVPSRAEPIADWAESYRRPVVLRDVSPLSQHLSLGVDSRCDRTHHCGEPS